MKKQIFFLIAGIPLLLTLLLNIDGFAQNDWAVNNNVNEISPATLKLLPQDVQEKIKKASQRETAPSSSINISSEDSEKNISSEDSENLKQAPRISPPALSKVDSKIETRYRAGYASTLAHKLNQFGYDLFDSIDPKISRLAVPDDTYILGPGDKLRIRIWGSEIDAEFAGAISREGTINVPKIGIVQLSGTKLGAVENIIRKEAEKYIQGININITLQELRSVEVYIVGSVYKPGLHLVPAFSTIIDGLLAGGGVKKSGSLRYIELFREEKLFKRFDLYDLLLKGSRKFDVLLEDRDVLFIPRLGKTAAIAGAVRQEAIFELKNEKSIQDLIDLAGGILPQGLAGRLYLRRFKNNRVFLIKDIDTQKNEKQWQSEAIQAGDLLELKFVPAEWPQVVKLEGHIWRPDLFQYRPGLKLSDILTSRELLQPGAMMDFGYLFRFDPKTTRTTVKQFPLEKVFSGEYDAALNSHDRIEILSREDLGIKEDLIITGAVWKPGSYDHRPHLTLQDLIALSGGVKFGADLNKIELSRKEIKDKKVVINYFKLNLTENSEFELEPYDYILIPQIKDSLRYKTVKISGEVRYPGEYSIREEERLSDLIERSGGFTDAAYYYGAKYTSLPAKAIQQKSIETLIRKMEFQSQRAISEQAQTAVSKEAIESAGVAQEAVQGMLKQLKSIEAEGRVAIKLAEIESFRGSSYDFKLEPGDSLFIPKRPNFIAVVGSVFSPSAYLYEPNMTLDYYLSKSGGPTKSADDDHIYLLKANGEVISKDQMSGMFSRFGKVELMPGDTIVVPENLERVPYLRLVKDITDIIFKIAVTAGVALAL